MTSGHCLFNSPIPAVPKYQLFTLTSLNLGGASTSAYCRAASFNSVPVDCSSTPLNGLLILCRLFIPLEYLTLPFTYL